MTVRTRHSPASTGEERLAHAVIMRALYERSVKFFSRGSVDLEFWCSVIGADPDVVSDAARARLLANVAGPRAVKGVQE